MKYISLLLISILFFGCVTEKRRKKICLECPVQVEKTDSSFYKETVALRKRILKLEADSANAIFQLNPCPDGTFPTIATKETTDGVNTTVRTNYDSKTGTFTAKAYTKPRDIDVTDSTKTIEKGKTSTESKQMPCPEIKYPFGFDFFYWAGISFTVLGIILFIIGIFQGVNYLKKKAIGQS